jgi:hypothetical protein
MEPSELYKKLQKYELYMLERIYARLSYRNRLSPEEHRVFAKVFLLKGHHLKAQIAGARGKVENKQ